MNKLALFALLLMGQSLKGMDDSRAIVPQDECALCRRSLDDNSLDDTTRIVHFGCLSSSRELQDSISCTSSSGSASDQPPGKFTRARQRFSTLVNRLRNRSSDRSKPLIEQSHNDLDSNKDRED